MSDQTENKTTADARPVTLIEAEAAIATFVATLESLVRKGQGGRRGPAGGRRRP